MNAHIDLARVAAVCLLVLCGTAPFAQAGGQPGAAETSRREAREPFDRIPNNFPILNDAGTAATYSNAGFLDLTNPFHVSPQGSNGRSCESCHLPHAGWSIRPVDVELLFLFSGGSNPIFNKLDADSPTAKVGTRKERYAAFSMLRKGLFRRGGNLSQDADFEIVAVDDPLKAGGSTSRFEFFRRPLATANFQIQQNVGWHDQFTNGSGDVHAGLTAQAAATFPGALQAPAASAVTLEQIAVHQEGLSFAQQSIFGLGSLSSCGAQGGPENLSQQPPVNGRFTLYDAWIGLTPGSCTTRAADRKRAQIARGQELFNGVNANGRSCRGCHNAQNDGTNVNGTLFNIGTSSERFRKPGMPLYTVRNKSTQDEHQTTDPGRALKTGRWADLDKFKTPSLRGVVARPPYFHNGIAGTLTEVVRHYEAELGFVHTREEREDLVAFLEAL